MTRHRAVVAVYWLALVAGLVFYAAIRSRDPAAVVPLWIGVLAGTALGHVLAVHGFPFWITAVIGVGLGANLILVPFAPELLVLAFIPATLCAWWSLSDRAALAALWFPAVIWMLSILDRARAHAMPDGAGFMLLGALAVVFVIFLRVRESRRVELWRTVASVPLAREEPRAVLKERPVAQLARAGWALAVSALTFAITAWIAPRLWRTETFGRDDVPVLADGQIPPACCHVTYDPPARARVKEYFDIGRGRDVTIDTEPTGIDCRACFDAGDGEAAGTAEPGQPSRPIWRTPTPESHLNDPPSESSESAPGPSTASSGPTRAAPLPAPTPPPTAPPPKTPAPTIPPPTTSTPEPPSTPAVSPPTPTVPPPTPAVPPPTPAVPPPSAPALAPPPMTYLPPPHQAIRVPAVARPPRADDGTGLALHWIAVLVAGALVFQIVGLALRPLRRLITVRHLRRPFWDETIDQRASNSWQLALIGLRDAGWRATAAEAPREFARRAGVAGIERCATILERVRHGIRVDDGDLDAMRAAADTAYASARARAGAVSRALSWLRWPLT